MKTEVEMLAEWIICQCGVVGLRNAGGRWQTISDEEKLQARLERMLTAYLKETCQKLERQP